ncbi:MAG: hypothetical protein V1922_05905 [bacterium]
MKHILKIVIIAIITLGISVGLWFYLNGYLSKSKASGETARLRFSKTSVKANGGDEVRVDIILSTESSSNANLGISGVDLMFNNTGGNLEFLYAKSAATMPGGFDERILDEAGMTIGTSPKQLKRVMFAATKPSGQLQKSIIIPLYFKVIAAGQSSITSIVTVDAAASQVVGPSGFIYPVTLDAAAPNFTVEISDPRAASATNLACNTVRNTNRANCEKGIAFTWGDAANEEGYKIYKDNLLIKTLGKDATSYNDMWCANFNAITYSVIAYNAAGSISTTLPTVSCACQICPTQAPPTPTPIQPTNSSDLIFRVIFPDAAPTVNEIPNVRITILDDEGKRVCNDDTDCAKVVTFKRVPDSRVPNTFRSPQLQYLLKINQGYSVVVKQSHTVKQTYIHVYLKWQKVLQCLEGTRDSGCGQLIEEVVTRPLFSGDLDGSNVIDQADLDKVSGGIGVNSAEGDLNFDGITDQKDVEVLGRNFNKKGT